MLILTNRMFSANALYFCNSLKDEVRISNILKFSSSLKKKTQHVFIAFTIWSKLLLLFPENHAKFKVVEC
jgi:hypothetical protein